ncbi:MAG: transglutaminase domain-containing protein, partial [Lachnospiraceae bacterium]|nr:transglutaminase domain-containing protein [Lachnospiraceae bacterium]
MEQYYYNHMTKTEQEVYYGIMNGVTNYDTSILLPALDIKDVQNVFFLMRLDHPEIFYVTGFKYSYYRDSPNIIFTPEYLFEKAKIKEHQKALKARIDKLALKAKNECKTELEKELFIHDFICENITYDKLKKPYSHEIIGPLGHGVGVCEGIAKSVKALCDALGIWCIIAICGNNPQKGIKYRHTW